MLFVRTKFGGTAPAYTIADIGYVVATGSTYKPLCIATATDPRGGTGPFTAVELKDSNDLFVAITTAELEWSQDGIGTLTPLNYDPDMVLVSQISNITTQSPTITASQAMFGFFDGGGPFDDFSGDGYFRVDFGAVT